MMQRQQEKDDARGGKEQRQPGLEDDVRGGGRAQQPRKEDSARGGR